MGHVVWGKRVLKRSEPPKAMRRRHMANRWRAFESFRKGETLLLHGEPVKLIRRLSVGKSPGLDIWSVLRVVPDFEVVYRAPAHLLRTKAETADTMLRKERP